MKILKNSKGKDGYIYETNYCNQKRYCEEKGI